MIMSLKKIIYLIVIFVGIFTVCNSQIYTRYSTDTNRIKYAVFDEDSTRGMNGKDFFSSFLRLDSLNSFIALDTIRSPIPSFFYVKYQQLYAGYEVENAIVTLSFRNSNIIRFSGFYMPISNIDISVRVSKKDAIKKYKQHFSIDTDSNIYNISLLITNDNSNHSILCYRIESVDMGINGNILYIDASNATIIKEQDAVGSGFNSLFYTQYNGVRQGNSMCLLMGSDTTYVLRDRDAAVQILKIESNVTNLSSGVFNTFYNNSTIWGYPPNGIYPNYMLDAYWAATIFSNHFQNQFLCPKEFFQRQWDNDTHLYEVRDTFTSLYIASNTFVDNTFWSHQLIEDRTKDFSHNYYKNIIVIGSPGSFHNPKASIDEVVHEFAHIFHIKHGNHYLRII